MTDLQSRYEQAHRHSLTPANQPPAPTCCPPKVTITRFRKNRVEVVERTADKERVVSRVRRAA